MSPESDARLRLDELSPSELLETFDNSVEALGIGMALDGSSWTDAVAALYTCEAQLAAAHDLVLTEEIAVWQGLKETLDARVAKSKNELNEMVSERWPSIA